ncbi:hypothetical protein FOZ61_002819 [Perkinsus olseni]|uniref:gamma-glutamylcyclotransferase n=1 Tax=Perkinsus olseni TaxID=32597 RepID=A0A7J6LS20_PEROL|nr:hypothetical protein FOZ61_002819 [Perkinsus olseni]
MVSAAGSSADDAAAKEKTAVYREPIPDGLTEVPMFSFGANMSTDSLRSRGIETGGKGPLRAVLTEYDLVFDMEPREIFIIEGCYANVRRSLGGRVHGVVNFLTRKGLQRLDDFESPFYERRWVTVQPYEGDALKAMIYKQPDNGERREGRPGRRYLKTLIAGAEKSGLDEEWITRLRSLPFVDFRKFDFESAERKASINRRVFQRQEIVDSHKKQNPLLVSLLGVVLAAPAKLEKIETMIYTSGDDFTLVCADFVSYEGSPSDARSITPEQRGFIETVLESVTSDTGRLEIVGNLPDDFDFYWKGAGNL